MPISHAFFLVGAPGAGKKVVTRMAAAMGVKVVSTSDLLKTHKREYPQLTEIMAKGELAEDDLISRLVKKEAEKFGNSAVIIDTVRSAQQVEDLWEFFTYIHGCRIDTIALEVSRENGLARMAKRRSKEQRIDDNESTSVLRMNKFEEYGPKVLAYLSHCTSVYTIDTNIRRKPQVAHATRLFIAGELETPALNLVVPATLRRAVMA